MKIFVNTYIAPFIAYWLIKLISLTLRQEEVGKEIETRLHEKGPTILLFWHGRLFYYPHYYKGRNHEYKILVSPSIDGEIIAKTLAAFGFGIIRGSSFKSARSALRELKRTTDEGFCAAMIADGSRGPIYQLQPGALMLSKLTGAPALPTTVSFSRYWTLKSWDRLMIPKPFSKVVVMYADPVRIPKGCDSAKLEEIRAGLEKTMVDMTARADGWFEGK